MNLFFTRVGNDKVAKYKRLHEMIKEEFTMDHIKLGYAPTRRSIFSAPDAVKYRGLIADRLRELGIDVTTSGAGWDTAYDQAQSEPLIWGWGAHTPMELYNIYHTMDETGLAEYSPYANETVDKYMDEALAASDLESSYDLWKKAQWDGETGITQEGDIPWIWLCNIDHLYFDILEKIIFQILNIGKGQLRSRNESEKSFYHYNYATVANTFNFNRKNSFLIHIILDSVPWIRIIEMIFIVCHCFCYFICL